MSKPNQPSRRTFIKASTAAALAAPTIISPRAFAKGDTPAPSDRINIGSIGVGDLGRRHHLFGTILKNPRMRCGAIADPDAGHMKQALEGQMSKTKNGEQHTPGIIAVQGKEVPAYKDFRDLCDRKDIDAVLIAVPDHWHALCAIYACEAGKDVYCEKPLSYTIHEGRKMADAVARYGTVFQTGSMQRSDKRFRQACELVRSGKIGKVQRVDTYVGASELGTWQDPVAPPAELDWNFWLGPAPWSEYMENCVHYQFRWRADYSGGKMTDWGAHHNDIAQWGLGMDASGPVKVSGEAKFPTSGPYDVASHFDIDYTYGNGVTLHCHSDGDKEMSQKYKDRNGSNGIKFTGDKGWIFVNRGVIGASDPEILTAKAAEGDVKLYNSKDHHENWLDCIKTREKPICDVEVGHRSATVCHLGNIAIRLGRELAWDPTAEKFVGDDQANLLTSRPMRAPWHL